MDNPVAMINVSGVSETWYYYYADALGSIRLLAHESGAIAESYAYDVYGRPRIMTAAGTDGNWLTEDTATQDASAVGNPYLFTARRWDAATALYHYRHRDYAPALGRFLQPDPLGYVDGMNLYAYCGNNPVNWIDPWGLCKETGGESGELPYDARFAPGKTPPKSWPDPGPGWKWNNEGYYEKKGERKHYHPEEPRHGPEHWDIEDRKGNHIGKQFIKRVPSVLYRFIFVAPKLIIDSAFPNAPGSYFNEEENRRRQNSA